jgi:hypothetical protein
MAFVFYGVIFSIESEAFFPYITPMKTVQHTGIRKKNSKLRILGRPYIVSLFEHQEFF